MIAVAKGELWALSSGSGAFGAHSSAERSRAASRFVVQGLVLCTFAAGHFRLQGCDTPRHHPRQFEGLGVKAMRLRTVTARCHGLEQGRRLVLSPPNAAVKVADLSLEVARREARREESEGVSLRRRANG